MSTHFGPIPVSGHRNAYAFMTNAIYDFTFGWPVTPHLGLGVGAVQLHDSISRKAPFVPISIASSSDWELGYQGIAGIRYNINPSLAFDLDYRYLATTDPTFRSSSPLGRYRSGYTSHNVVASLTVRFGAIPLLAPPVPPAPPPIARRVFLVVFDWDKSPLNPQLTTTLQPPAAAIPPP